MLTRCKYNNYITIQRSSHPNFYTSVDKNAACHPQDAKNMRFSRITHYQINVYPSILLHFLAFSPLSPRRKQQKTYQNRKLQSEKRISSRTVAAFRRIYSHAPRFSPHSSDRADLKSLFRGFRPADVRPFPPLPPPAAAATSALSAAFRHFFPALARKPRVFGDLSPHFRSYLRTTTNGSRPQSPKTNESCTPKQARLAAKRQQRRPPQPNEKFDCGGKTKAPSSPQPKKTERTSCAKRMRMNMARG